MASSAERTVRTVRFLVRMRALHGRCARQGADSFPAGSLRLRRRRANIEICSFFCSRTKLTRESPENSCASGQTWYRKSTELVLTGRKLYVACTKSVLVGIESAKLARSSTGKRVRHAVPLQLLDKLSIVASWGAACLRRAEALRTGAAGSQDESGCSAIHKQRPYRGYAWTDSWGVGGESLALGVCSGAQAGSAVPRKRSWRYDSRAPIGRLAFPGACGCGPGGARRVGSSPGSENLVASWESNSFGQDWRG